MTSNWHPESHRHLVSAVGGCSIPCILRNGEMRLRNTLLNLLISNFFCDFLSWLNALLLWRSVCVIPWWKQYKKHFNLYNGLASTAVRETFQLGISPASFKTSAKTINSTWWVFPGAIVIRCCRIACSCSGKKLFNCNCLWTFWVTNSSQWLLKNSSVVLVFPPRWIKYNWQLTKSPVDTLMRWRWKAQLHCSM